MYRVKRRYPRVPYDQPGEMEVSVVIGGRPEKVRLPVTIRSISCEGLGATLSRPSHSLLTRGANVTVSFRAGERHFLLPGRIAWHATEMSEPFDLGIKLQLAAARADMRQSYASWIVTMISTLRDLAEQQPRQSGH